MKYMDKSCIEFIKLLSSKDPVPGGGGASALVGAAGMALGSMVGELTVGKKKYASVEADIKVLIDEIVSLQNDLMDLAEKDAEVFAPLAKAYGLPKDTEKEIAEKNRVMSIVLKDATLVPLEIMRKCCIAIELHEEFAAKGSTLAISDTGVGVIFCKAALQGASLNVYINTKAMCDREFASLMNEEADAMLTEYTKRADDVYNEVVRRLR